MATEDEKESLAYLGNYGEPAKLDDCHIFEVPQHKISAEVRALLDKAKEECADLVSEILT